MVNETPLVRNSWASVCGIFGGDTCGVEFCFFLLVLSSCGLISDFFSFTVYIFTDIGLGCFLNQWFWSGMEDGVSVVPVGSSVVCII